MTRLQNGNYSVKTALSTNWATFNVSTSGHMPITGRTIWFSTLMIG